MKILRLAVLQFIEKSFLLNFSFNNKKYKTKRKNFYKCMPFFQGESVSKKDWHILMIIYNILWWDIAILSHLVAIAKVIADI